VEKPKEVAVMGESNGKKNKNSVYHTKFSHKLSEKDIPFILDGLQSYKSLIGIADYLDCNYSSLLTFINKTPLLAEAKFRANEGRLDIAESKLMFNIAQNNLNAIFFFLDRMGRNRGYGQHQEIDAKVKDTAPRIVIGTIGKERIEAAKKMVAEATKEAKAGMPDDETQDQQPV